MIDQLIGSKEIQSKVVEIGRQIEQDYVGKDLLMVCVLKGAIFFYADLIRCISLPFVLDFIVVSSRDGEISGDIQIIKGLKGNLTDKHILIIEDIIDTGKTLRHIIDDFSTRSPASIKTCCLLDKPSRREVDIEPDYVGFEVEDKFLVGYGLDLNENHRNLPYIGVISA